MIVKRKYVVSSQCNKSDDDIVKTKVVVKSSDNMFNFHSQFIAKNSDSDKVLEVYDDGICFMITDSEGNDFYLGYGELNALKAILTVDDYIEKNEHTVKMKSIKPKGATIAYQGDPDDAKLNLNVNCYDCEEPWRCVGCKYEFGNG